MMNHNLPRVLLEKLSFFKSTDHGAMNFDAKTIDSGNSQIEKCLHQNHNLFKKPKNILGKKNCSASSVHTAETVVSQDIELNSIENINESNTTIINDANSINDNVDNNLIKSHSYEDLNDMVLEDIKTIHGVVQQNLEGLTENDKTDLETFPQHLNSAKITPTPNFSMQSDVITITKKDHKYFDDETKESYNTLEDIHKKSCIEKHHVQQFDTDNVKLMLNTTEAAKSLIQSFVREEKNAKITNVVSNDCKSEKFVEEKSSETNFDIVFEAECNLIDQTKSSSLQFDLCQEDKLIELAIIGNRDMEDLSNDDDDLSGYQASYEISDQLENILAFELEGQAIDFIRDESQEDDDFSLSPIQATSKRKMVDLNDTPSSPPSKKSKINLLNTLSTVSKNTTISDNSNDPDFNPNEVRFSSTVLEESSSGTIPCSTDSLVPDITEDENYSNELTRDVFGTKSGKQNKIINSDRSSSDSTITAPNYINSESGLRKIPFSRVGSIDNTDLIVQTNTETPRWKKKYHCMICHKLVVKLPRHLETVHKNHEEVKKLKNLAPATQERKKVISIFRNNGNQIYNTNANYNKDKELLVPRRPKNKRPATDYTTCPNCFLTVTKTNSRKHISKCCRESNLIKGSRTYKVLGRIVEGRLHSTACDKLRLVIFPVLREDHIVRLIRYDWLIILWGNKLCIKHGPHFQQNHIRAKLRLVGRFLSAAKQINSNIEDLSTLYTPKYINTVIESIDIVARIDRMQNTCEAPAVALNLVTYLKQIGIILESEYVKREDEDKQKQVINFLKVYLTEMPDSVNKVGMESQAQIKRQKVVVLPMTDDIQKMLTYLKMERIKIFDILKKEFKFETWLRGLRMVAIYLLVFNRRRVGDIQNILVSDLDQIEKIDKVKDKEEFNSLDDAGKKIAQRFYRFKIRGKVNRTVAVIADLDLIQELKLLNDYRSQAHIPTHNPFLFGLPNPVTDRIRVLNLCKEMRTISEECGAKEPHLLRGTTLRKHVATKCVELDLKASALGDVIGHLGHSEHIHKNIYQQKLKSKTIVQVTKVLEAAQGDLGDDDFDDDNNDDKSDFIEISKEDLHTSVSSNINHSQSFEPMPSTSTDDSNFFLKPAENLHQNENITEIATNHSTYRLWSQLEKDAIHSEFKSFIDQKTLPPFSMIDEVKSRYPCLNNRKRDAIKTWIRNQFQSEVSAKGEPRVKKTRVTKPGAKKLKIIGNKPMKLNLRKIVDEYNDDSDADMSNDY